MTVRDLQQQLAAARQQAEDARAAVAKSEADLEDLSGAYNTLEAHAFKLEGQLRAQETGVCADSAALDSPFFRSESMPSICSATHAAAKIAAKQCTSYCAAGTVS